MGHFFCILQDIRHFLQKEQKRMLGKKALETERRIPFSLVQYTQKKNSRGKTNEHINYLYHHFCAFYVMLCMEQVSNGLNSIGNYDLQTPITLSL